MSRASGADGPENVDATFEEIVADLRAEGVGSEDIPGGEDDDGTGTAVAPRDAGVTDDGPRATGRSGWRASGTEWDDTMFGPDPAEDDEHYVPPEPPPLPKPRKGAFVVLLFFVAGLLLLIAPTLIGLTRTVGTPLGMLALATGIALLLLRVTQRPSGSDNDDPSDGAQV